MNKEQLTYLKLAYIKTYTSFWIEIYKEGDKGYNFHRGKGAYTLQIIFLCYMQLYMKGEGNSNECVQSRGRKQSLLDEI